MCVDFSDEFSIFAALVHTVKLVPQFCHESVQIIRPNYKMDFE